MPTNVIFLIALLVIMAAMVIFTFVFVILADRSLNSENNEAQRDSSDNEESIRNLANGNTGKRALVTGGAGLIGSHLTDLLLAEGYAVRIIDNLEPQTHRNGKPPWISV